MRIAALARGAAVAAALTLTLGAAQAQEGVMIKNLLGSMGIISPEREPIRYRERAPLVLPPRMELREPAAPGSLAAANPAWPNDPDVAARRRKEAEARAPVTQSEVRRMSDNNPRLSIDEIRAGRRPGGEVPAAPVVRRGDNTRDSTWVNPDQLRREGRTEESATTVDGEPTRKILTDPPTGMRRSASGEPVKPSFEPWRNRNDEEADPKAYISQQARGR